MKGHFRTAYLQREIPLDIKATEAYEVGDVVTLTKATYTDSDGNSNVYWSVAKKTGALTPAIGDYIVAQSDMTLKSGAIGYTGTDPYGYYYNDSVAVSGVADLPKRGAFYKVTNVEDVYYTAD